MCIKAVRKFVRLGCFETLFWKNHEHLPQDGSPREPGVLEACCIGAHRLNHRLTFIFAIIGIIFAILYTSLFIYLELPWFVVVLPIIELVFSILVLIGNMENRPWMYWPHFVWNFFLVVLFLLLCLIFLLGGLAYARRDDYAEKEAVGIFPKATRAQIYIYGLLIILGLFFHAVLAAVYVAFSYRDYMWMRDYLVDQRYNKEDGKIYPANVVRPLEIVPPKDYYSNSAGHPSYDLYTPPLSADDRQRIEEGHHVHYVPIRIERDERSNSRGKSFVDAFTNKETLSDKFAKNPVLHTAEISPRSPQQHKKF
ncbi:unnamed protein product [Bursaphelenchus xylophilus]|uniref:(pine wood nematode) hypothetical protein n=1 Tax=Bursaphelenchus xylophilus TaxID=6326 RepID=A0A1I7S164_BURXY|nr:unnamed protein product [Bursaphelenchus xylophilus]CAG9080031.1 unnamed protein product [Bursaphelenchus xylophilus]